jgi:hypothetical protein
MRTTTALPAAILAVLGISFGLTTPSPAPADEGVWTLDHLPVRALQTAYGFTPTPEWVEHVQKASVAFPGGSAAFVSEDGLVITNHHVARGQIQKLSTPEHDYLRDGFYARTQAEELPCPDLELRVLVTMEDVTARVRAAVDPKAAPKAQAAQLRAVQAKLEKEFSDRTRLQGRFVELYRGGEYWLYGYRRYTDVRLVMAPEGQAAYYGGDWDNFTYPRHDLDIAFVRVYENGKPVKPERWFRWSAQGPLADDLVFVSGHPGTTRRQLTVAQLEYLRDLQHPIRLGQLERRMAALQAFAATGDEPARRARSTILSVANNIKRTRGYLDVLRDPSLIEQKRREEMDLRRRVAANPQVAAETRGAWERIAAAGRELRRRHREHLYRDLDRTATLVGIATQIVRHASETEKPNELRLPEFRETQLETQRFRMFSPAPVYPDVDAVVLATLLDDARRALGPRDPWVKLALGGREPADVAGELMERTRVGDVGFRRVLVQGGSAAVRASDDPLIAWVRALEPLNRELRDWHEAQVQTVESMEAGRIARARFALDGKAIYPDATGTLRLSYGSVKGYEDGSTRVPWKTTFLGLYDRAEAFDGRRPFDLPPLVAGARAKLDLATPLNFVSTCDIIGGNSGSPVLNRNLEFVGIVFDGNIPAFRWDYDYDDVQARCVAVHSAGILEALRRIYGMDRLADELTGGKMATR